MGLYSKKRLDIIDIKFSLKSVSDTYEKYYLAVSIPLATAHVNKVVFIIYVLFPFFLWKFFFSIPKYY